MTATTATANTNTATDETTTVDAEVVSSDAATDETTTVDVEATTVDDNDKTEAPQPKVDPKTAIDNAKECIEWARRREAVDKARSTAAQELQSNGHYHDVGCFYGSATPVAGALGAEFGVVTKDEKTNKVQRTGIGFYIRSDHMADFKYDYSDI